jgi:polyhydroxybutyrate depolymerase
VRSIRERGARTDNFLNLLSLALPPVQQMISRSAGCAVVLVSTLTCTSDSPTSDAAAPSSSSEDGSAPESSDGPPTSEGTEASTSADSSSSGGGSVVAGSPGCGADPPATGRYTIDVDGMQREYELDVPDDYDPLHPYRLIFGWHWLGGWSGNILENGYYGLAARSDGSAIFVAPEGIDNGWGNPDGRDIAFAAAMIDRLNDELCIDQERIFSTGWSFGGMMSNAAGCAMADTFRAIAPMSGSLWSGCESGDTPIAYWGSHGIYDDVVPLTAGQEARDEFLARNGCSSDTIVDGPCLVYQGCDEDAPVVWCEFEGPHGTPDFAPTRTWEFFAAF